VIYLLILDFAEYWRHRLSHTLRWWWALHAIHHSQRQMTLWTDSRNHLLDDLIGGFWFAVIALLIGVPPGHFIGLLIVVKTIENLSHVNARLSFGRLGELLLVSPRYHRWHHALDLPAAASTATAAISRSSFRSGINSSAPSIAGRRCRPGLSHGPLPDRPRRAASGDSNTRAFARWQRLSARIHARCSRPAPLAIMESQTAMLDEARAFALTAHGSQMYGDRPYAFHLEAVVSLLSGYGTDAQIVGYLHDVIEDTGSPRTRFWRALDDWLPSASACSPTPPAASRAERKAGTYARLATVAGPAELALVVKAADRLANVRSCVSITRLWPVGRCTASEHPSFRRAAYREGLCEPLWRELDALLNAAEVDRCLKSRITPASLLPSSSSS
jgi:hypothetical protein